LLDEVTEIASLKLPLEKKKKSCWTRQKN